MSDTKNPKPVSKSAFVKGSNCKKAFWFNRNLPFREIDNPVRTYRFEEGQAIGELARDHFGKGTLISDPPWEKEKALEKTNLAMKEGVEVLYEGYFSIEGFEARPDVLRRNGNGYDLLEVKSGTKVKDEHILDVSFQKWVLEKCGVKVKDCYLVHVNGQYVLGEKFSLKNFFVEEFIKKEVEKLFLTIEGFANELKRIVIKADPPNIPIGRHCSKPYECEYRDTCWKDVSIGSIHYLNRVTQKKLTLLQGKDIQTIDQIDDNEKLSALQNCQRKSWVQKEPIINSDGINDFLNSLVFPIAHLDFETLNPTVPVIKGMKPYEQYPFQFSIHIENESGGIAHHECLAEELDPRRKIAEELIRLIPQNGSVLAYHASFEKAQIRSLMSLFPDLSDALSGINDRILDLEKPFNSGDYVDFRFQGSTSIKKVLPILCPNLSYEDLEISNGSLAQIEYMQLLKNRDEREKKKIRKALFAYCKRDTEAMVKVLCALRSVARKHAA